MVSADHGLDEDAFAVLNAVVLKKSATADILAASTGVAPSAVARIVGELVDAGYLVDLGGQVMPDDSAVDTVKSYNEAHWSGLRGQPEVERWHQRFEHVNDLMLAAIDAWQQVRVGGEKIRNDHTDAAYDDKIISRIDGIIAKAEELLRQLGKRVPRFNRYPERFEAAMNQVEQDRRYISDPRVESVHNVWFEMHEDIFLLLGKERQV
jgi:hypothetical protein